MSRPLHDSIIRRKAQLHVLPLDRFRVSVARSAEELQRAFGLLHEAFVGIGIDVEREYRMRITPQHVLKETVVMVVWEETRAAGTLSVTLDSPAGIPLEKDYGEEIQALRERGARVAEIGSLAVLPEYRNSGAAKLLMMGSIWVSRNVFHATHTVIGVNPRAESFYRALFNFQRMGEPHDHAELTAPVVGLCTDSAEFEPFMREHWQHPMNTGKPLWEHFCKELPPCFEIPSFYTREESTHRKLPRDAFQEIFIQRSDRLKSLDTRTFRHLAAQRTDETLLNKK